MLDQGVRFYSRKTTLTSYLEVIASHIKSGEMHSEVNPLCVALNAQAWALMQCNIEGEA